MNDLHVRQAITRLKGRDVDGLEILVRLYQSKARRAAFLILLDPSLAEDVVQTAFLQVAAKIDQYDESRPFEPWFMRIVINFALQAIRHHHREISLDTFQFAESMTTLTDETLFLDEQMDLRDMRETIRQALDRLPPLQRAAIVMRYYLDMTEQDMVKALSLPKGTIKWRLHAARQQLRTLLSKLSPLPFMALEKEPAHDK